MEDTIDNKQKFLAKYYGQKIISYHNGIESILTINAESLEFIEKDYIPLTPLSLITDEHAKKLLEINNIIFSEFEIFENSFGNKVLSYGNYVHEKLVLKEHNLSLKQIDFLRGNGYALEWTNSEGITMSAEEQVKRGWVKLKRNE